VFWPALRPRESLLFCYGHRGRQRAASMFGSLAVSFAMLSPPVGAAPATGLQWSAPPECPSESDVQSWLNEAVGVVEGPVEAVVQRMSDEHWVVRIAVPQASTVATRTIAGESCPAVARATIVAIALAMEKPRLTAPAELQVDHDLAGPLDAGERLNPLPMTAKAETEANTPSDEKEDSSGSVDDMGLPRSNGSDLVARLGVTGRVGYGLLPGTAGGISGKVGLQGRRWWVDIGATHWFPTHAAWTATRSNAGIDLSLSTAVLEAGPQFRTKNVVFPLGLGVQLGMLRAQSQGAANDRTMLQFWAALMAKGGVVGSVTSWLALGVEVAIVTPLTRRSYVLQGETVHQMNRVGMEAGLVGQFMLQRRPKGPSTARIAHREPFRRSRS